MVSKSFVSVSIFLKLWIRSKSHIANFLKFSISLTLSLYFCSHLILSSNNNFNCFSFSFIFSLFSFKKLSFCSKVLFNLPISSIFSLSFFCNSLIVFSFNLIVSFKFFISTTAFSCLFINKICCRFNSIISLSFILISSKKRLFSSKMNFTFINCSSISPFFFFKIVFSSNNSCILFWKLITTVLLIFSKTLFKFEFSSNNWSIFS